MSAYTVVLFLHVLGAIGLFVGLALEGVVMTLLKAAGTLELARFSASTFNRLKYVFIPSFILVLFGGLYLASIIGSAATPWIPVSLGGFVLILLVGVLITGPRMGRLIRALGAASSPADFAAVKTQVAARGLLGSHCLRGGIAIGILFLMTTKPDLVTSLAVTCGAALLGLAPALWPRRLPTTCEALPTKGRAD